MESDLADLVTSNAPQIFGYERETHQIDYGVKLDQFLIRVLALP